MMRSTVVFLCLSAVLVSAGGCTSGRPVGVIYTNSSYDVHGLEGDLSDLKIGTSVGESYFGLFGFGDCSIATAAKNAGIKNIRIVDQDCKTVFGYTTITTKVYGTSGDDGKSKDLNSKK